jgi:chromosome segregation ATPase
LLKEYTQIIRKSKAKCDKLKYENEILTAKYDIVVKASDEMKEENKTMSFTVSELKSSLKDAKDKCDKLNEENRELKDRLVKIKEDYTKCWGPSASEGPQKHDLTMFLEYDT